MVHSYYFQIVSLIESPQRYGFLKLEETLKWEKGSDKRLSMFCFVYVKSKGFLDVKTLHLERVKESENTPFKCQVTTCHDRWIAKETISCLSCFGHINPQQNLLLHTAFRLGVWASLLVVLL